MKLNNEVWAFIPARSGSKSIKNKNIVLLKKKPLLAYSLESAKNCKTIHKIIFSTDSQKYFNIARKYGDFFFINVKNLFHLTQVRILMFFTILSKILEEFCQNFFVHLRPTTPFRSSDILDKIINQFIIKEKKFSSLRSVSLMTNPVHKSVIIKKNNLFSPILNSFSLDKINNPRQAYSNSYLPNGYIDIIKTKSIFKGFLHGNRVMPYISKNFVSDIDSLWDLKIAGFLRNNKKRK